MQGYSGYVERYIGFMHNTARIENQWKATELRVEREGLSQPEFSTPLES